MMTLVRCQTPAAPPRPAPVVEAVVGWAGFVDELLVNHAVAGASARFYVSRRVSLGPEI